MTETSRHAATAACLVLGAGDLVLLNLVVFPRALRGGGAWPAPVAVPAAPVVAPAAAPVVAPAAAREPPPAASPPGIELEPIPAPAPPVIERAPAPVPAAIYFPTAAFNLDRPARQAIDKLAQRMAALLKKDRGQTVVIEGHADLRGDEVLNDRLSHQRALAVSARLKARGVAPARIVVRRFGATRPAVDGDGPESLRLNRRVEIILGGGKS